MLSYIQVIFFLWMDVFIWFSHLSNKRMKYTMDIVLLLTLIPISILLWKGVFLKWHKMDYFARANGVSLNAYVAMYFLFSGGGHEDWCKGNEKGLQGCQTWSDWRMFVIYYFWYGSADISDIYDGSGDTSYHTNKDFCLHEQNYLVNQDVHTSGL